MSPLATARTKTLITIKGSLPSPGLLSLSGNLPGWRRCCPSALTHGGLCRALLLPNSALPHYLQPCRAVADPVPITEFGVLKLLSFPVSAEQSALRRVAEGMGAAHTLRGSLGSRKNHLKFTSGNERLEFCHDICKTLLILEFSRSFYG